MCRNIRTLANFHPPATDEEIRASALQFVRKLSGSSRPSKANQEVFDRAVAEVTEAATRLVRSLTTKAPPRDREEEARKARERGRARAARTDQAAEGSDGRTYAT
jgi:hypothetical protein